MALVYRIGRKKNFMVTSEGLYTFDIIGCVDATFKYLLEALDIPNF